MVYPILPIEGGMRLTTGCKINLFLRVKNRLPDGYHELESIFLPLSVPCDTMDIFPVDGGSHQAPGGIQVECQTQGIDPQDNTLTKAHALFWQATGLCPQIRVLLKKGVAPGSGLGGGSADAAGLLHAMALMARKDGGQVPDEDLLMQIGSQVGADVPFFLKNRPAFVRGKGEKLYPIAVPCPGMRLVLVCPDLHVSTAWAFRRLATFREQKRFTTSALVPVQPGPDDNLTNKLLEYTTPIAQGILPENDFEAIVFPVYPALSALQKQLLDSGAVSARLSGTGSSIFGLFSDKSAAGKTASALRKQGLRVYTYTM